MFRIFKRNTTDNFEPIKVGNRGKLFELLVGRIEECIKIDPSIEIYPNYTAQNLEGFERQIDVLIKSNINDYQINIAIECKEYKDPVDVEKMEAFKCKCDRIPLINKKVFVSQSGYTKGAVAAAKIYGIDLISISDLKENDTIFSWTRPLKFYLQKRYIRILSVLVQKQDSIFYSIKDLDSTTIEFKDYDKPITIREFCTSYLINQSLEEWKSNFGNRDPEKPSRSGYRLFPKVPMIISDSVDSFTSEGLIFHDEVFESNMALEKKGDKEYGEFRSEKTKAKIFTLEGEGTEESGIAEIIIPHGSDLIQVNYSLIRDKQIICSDSEMFYIRDFIK